MASDANQAKVLLQDVTTRWNSTYLMLKRIQELKTVVQLFLLSHPTATDPLTSNDFIIIAKVITILKPFYRLTLEFSSNLVSIAVVIPNLIGLKKFLAVVDASRVGTLRDTLQEQVDTRFFSSGGTGGLNILTNRFYTVPTLLDPRLRRCIPEEHKDDAKVMKG
jgi:hypothetical protein